MRGHIFIFWQVGISTNEFCTVKSYDPPLFSMYVIFIHLSFSKPKQSGMKNQYLKKVKYAYIRNSKILPCEGIFWCGQGWESRNLSYTA